jgi:3-ketosteroid 9alpha-monooxygenase subunit B
MAVLAAGTTHPGPARDHRFHPLRVARVVRETADASTFVLEVPPELQDVFAYEAGQFCTFRVAPAGGQLLRCYSMSSAPGVDDELSVIVKRVPGGAVSNWMIDDLCAGDTIETTGPAGVFVLGPGDRDLVLFAGGSGITPVFSLIKSALATTTRKAHLLYANRDPGSVIFTEALCSAVTRYPGRLRVEHHLDDERGYVDAEEVLRFASAAPDADFYICGPEPFMAVVEAALHAECVASGRVHIERFTPEPPPAGASAQPACETMITVEVEGRTATAAHRPGATILQMARELGLAPPSSCESGNCATCMGKVVEGTATMRVNNALTDDEVAAGWVLTCQAVPSAPAVRVVYAYE